MSPDGMSRVRQVLLGSGVISGVSYSAEATAYFAAMSVQPDATRKGLIDTLISGLKTDGVWTGFDMFKIEAAHDVQAARLNAVAPASNVSAAVNSPVFTVDRGYATDGASSYINLNWAPSTGVQYTLNTGCLGAYVNVGAGAGSDTATVIGSDAGSTSGAQLITLSAASNLRGRINASARANVGSAVTGRTGLSVITRTDSATIAAYKNGVSLGTMASAAAAVSSRVLYQGANNSNGSLANFSAERGAIVLAGRDFTSTEHAAIYSRINTFLTAIGAN